MMQPRFLKRAAFLALLLLAMAFVRNSDELPVVFVDGAIYTMDGNNSIVQAALVVDGRIAATGSTEQMLALAPPSVQKIELNGRALLPGFVDAHSHFPVGVIEHLGVDLSATSHKPVVSNDELLKRINEAVKLTPSGDWVVGFNYDNTVFPDGQHPVRAQLDAITTEHPVYLRHVSGHMGVVNSLALRAVLDEAKASQLSQFIGVDETSGVRNGLLQEHAAPGLSRLFTHFSISDIINAYRQTQSDYLAAGVTTVQNGLANQQTARLLRALHFVGVLPMRVNSWVKSDVAHDRDPLTKTNYRQATVKLIVDGSPQGKTAYLTQPYFDSALNGDSFRGAALYSQVALDLQVLHFHKAGYQIALHGNGDAAIDMIIAAIASAQKIYPRPDARHVLVHAQTIRADQLAQLKPLSLTPSFFNSHTYYWGDWHNNVTLGTERASFISPLAAAQREQLRFTLHSDAPVTPMDPMHLLWSAMTRQTRSGIVLGDKQRIDLNSALRALTIDAAWQGHMEHDRGSIEEGKLADLIVLSGDPAAVDDVRTLAVDLTYIGGDQVFSRK